MMFPVDIHTHHAPLLPGSAIVNVSPDSFAPETGEWYSVGVHPWQVEAGNALGSLSVAVCRKLDELASLVNHPQVLAVGEAGLDKLAAAPLAVQAAAFRHQAALAMQMDKPLVIHLVRATDELLALRRELRPSNPWIIHGFRGKAALAQAYLRQGFYLSFGEKYQAEALRVVPDSHLLLETDESTIPVETLYERAAVLRATSPTALMETVRSTVADIFFKGKSCSFG